MSLISLSSLCTFIFYLFKAEVYGCMERQAVATDPAGFYFTAVYLFILGICFRSFFGRNKLIFHSNVYLAVLFCLGMLGLFPSCKAGPLSSG